MSPLTPLSFSSYLQPTSNPVGLTSKYTQNLTLLTTSLAIRQYIPRLDHSKSLRTHLPQPSPPSSRNVFRTAVRVVLFKGRLVTSQDCKTLFDLSPHTCPPAMTKSSPPPTPESWAAATPASWLLSYSSAWSVCLHTSHSSLSTLRSLTFPVRSPCPYFKSSPPFPSSALYFYSTYNHLTYYIFYLFAY